MCARLRAPALGVVGGHTRHEVGLIAGNEDAVDSDVALEELGPESDSAGRITRRPIESRQHQDGAAQVDRNKALVTFLLAVSQRSKLHPFPPILSCHWHAFAAIVRFTLAVDFTSQNAIHVFPVLDRDTHRSLFVLKRARSYAA
jgi:hypothetical protein